jgi:hypothetical protein
MNNGKELPRGWMVIITTMTTMMMMMVMIVMIVMMIMILATIMPTCVALSELHMTWLQ